MGNWRTVEMSGRMSPIHAEDCIDLLAIEYDNLNDEEWEALADSPIEYLRMHRSLCGIGQWVDLNGTIEAHGNLSAKSPTEEDVLAELKYLAKKFDSLDLVMHMGGNYESKDCVASFTVENGVVEQHQPMVETVSGASPATMDARMFNFLVSGNA